jgi:branched-subunit amino acid aminotransferase/4-amino-4-deoxychorismate lyase
VITPARRPFPDGSGIFETLRTEDGLVAEFGRHMRRALSASQSLGIRMPNEESIRNQVQSVLNENPYRIGRLRICISNSGLVVTHDEYDEITEGGYLTFSPHTSKAKGEQFKTYPYDEHYEVVDEARAHGFDDAMIFNSANNVTETGLSNIALFIDGLWVTPPITAGILPGVMRAIAVERCDVQVRNVHITEVPSATEIVLLGSLRIAQPVVQVGEMRLANGAEAATLVAQMREKVEYFSVG